MKHNPVHYVTDFAGHVFSTVGTMLPVVVVGGSLIGIGYLCNYPHRMENIVVEESEKDCATDE